MDRRPLRILHCLRAPVGGLFRHVLDLAGEESRRGHAVGIVADSSTGDRLTAPRFAAIEPHLALGLHLIPMRRQPGLGDLAAAYTTSRIARRLPADVLHGHGAKGGAFARLAAAALALSSNRPRCFYTPHGGSLHFDPRSAEGRLYLGLEKVLGRVTDGIVFESDFARRTYEQRIGLGRMAWRIIPNGLAPGDFFAAVPDEDAAEFLFVGELRHLKGVDVLLHALALVNRTYPARAVIVGDGPDAATFKADCERLDLQHAVRFTGALPARQAFSLGRCLVVPSRAESFPYIVLEAAAAGLPLLATDVGGIPEMVAGTDNRLVAPGDASALAAAMIGYLDDAEGARARARDLEALVARRFTVEAMTSGILAFQTTPASTDRLADDALTQS
ncbi:MAG: glycosyltransferase family 4 protein [Hyphomicrobium sp.]